MSATMMLNYIADVRKDPHSRTVAERIRAAYDGALTAGEKTRDLGGRLGTAEFARAVIERL
jgi:isocitrate/isopropylmalate dehydrogenase